jgi:hypothetical protein
MAGRVSGLGVFYATTGGILLWSGFKGQTLAETIKAITSGNAAALNQQGSETVGSPTVATSSSAGSGTGSGSASSSEAATAANTAAASAPAADKTGTPAANKALGLLMASAYGWGGSGEWPYLESGWQEESGWNQYAANVPADPYEHAYGIPQANPGTKMATAGSDWETNPVTQIRWGLDYIKATYGSPSQVPGWTPDGPAAGYTGY